MIRHHFTVDVEEYFQVSALEAYAPYASWEGFESRVERSVERLLALLAEKEATGTFFTLGWVAERHPEMMRRIAEAGHEIASHGFRHELVTRLTPEQFRDSIRRSKAVLEDLTGQEVTGYRAPSFSIVAEVDWAFDVLVEEGYAYDSSVYPGRRGHPLEPRRAYAVRRAAGVLTEYPISTLRGAGRTFPAGGGAYLRLLPYGLVRGGLVQAEREGASAMFYIHPWELDPEQPRLRTDLKTRIRHYGGLRKTEGLLRRMLSEFRFGSIRPPVTRAVSA